MSTVTGRYTDAQGTPVSGTVYISPAARAGIGEPPDIVVEKRVWADLDAQGSISIDVIPSDDPGWLIDGKMPYLVEERLMGLPFRSYWIGVPDAGVDLSAVQHVDPDVAPMPVPGPQGPPGIQGPEGPQGPPGEDFTPTDADARYVNADGDTMTGRLDLTSAGTVLRLAIGGAMELRGLSDTNRAIVSALDGTWFRLRAVLPEAKNLLQVTTDSTMRLMPDGGSVTVPAPTAAQQVPRLARTPNPATGDLGLPGYAGSDTGWRDVTSLLANGWGVEANGFAKIRRVGSTVTFVIRNVSQPGTNQTVFALPDGFSFGTEYGVTRYFDSTASNTSSGATISGNNINLPTTWTTGSTTRQVVCSGTTADPWPSSLPGTQVTPPASWT